MSEDLVSVEEALEIVLATVTRGATERTPLADALGRVLAEPVTAAGDVPPFANSAMDGFAVSSGPAGRRLRIAGESRAGHPSETGVEAGTAIRISTGAVVPAGAGGVAPVEQVREQDGEVVLEADVAAGAHIRAPGEDVRAGQGVLAAGVRLGPVELGVAVGAGVDAVLCGARPRVAVLCTGDELRAPGEALGPGQIHNSNATMLAALAERAGAHVVSAERVADTPADTRAALERALAAADVVVLSGGVSVGAHDHVKGALESLGVEQRLWGIALRPGKPTWFGARGAQLVFGLPGNPVSAAVTFALFARPALLAFQGADGTPALAEAELAAPLPRGRREQAVRVRLVRRGGRLLATSTGPQGSHVLSSLLGADALALIPAGRGVEPAGAVVRLAALWE